MDSTPACSDTEGIPTYAEYLIRMLAKMPSNSLVLWCGSRMSRARVRPLVPERVEIVAVGLSARMLFRLGLRSSKSQGTLVDLDETEDIAGGLRQVLEDSRLRTDLAKRGWRK